jgi:hypothetical protein
MNTFAIIAHTQVLENYGSPDKPHWKCKGGDAYYIANLVTDQSSATVVQIAGNLPPAREVETRDSNMLIEYCRSFEAIDVAEAERRAAINVNDDDLDPDVYFSAVTRRGHVETYRMGGC